MPRIKNLSTLKAETGGKPQLGLPGLYCEFHSEL